MEKAEYMEMILNNALKINNVPIELKNGVYSNVYVDMRDPFQKVEISQYIAKYLSNYIKSIEESSGYEFDGFVGVPKSATHIAKLITKEFYSDGRNLNYLELRQVEKYHGNKKGKWLFGPNNEKNLCVVEDVFTTGGSIKSTLELIDQNVSCIISCIDRSGNEKNHIEYEGRKIKYFSVIKIEEVLEHGIQMESFDENEIKLLQKEFPNLRN